MESRKIAEVALEPTLLFPISQALVNFFKKLLKNNSSGNLPIRNHSFTLMRFITGTYKSFLNRLFNCGLFQLQTTNFKKKAKYSSNPLT